MVFKKNVLKINKFVISFNEITYIIQLFYKI